MHRHYLIDLINNYVLQINQNSRQMVHFQGLFKANSNSRHFQGIPTNSRPFQACANPAIRQMFQQMAIAA